MGQLATFVRNSFLPPLSFPLEQTANIQWAHKPHGTHNISLQTEDIIYYDSDHVNKEIHFQRIITIYLIYRTKYPENKQTICFEVTNGND